MPVKVKKQQTIRITADEAESDALYEIKECRHPEMIGCVAELISGYDYDNEELRPDRDYFVILRSYMAIYRGTDSWDSLLLRPIDSGDTLIVVD